MLAIALLLSYFWYLQVLRGRYYRELAENNRIRTIPIAAPRGPLLDRHGRVLVEDYAEALWESWTFLHFPDNEVPARPGTVP